MSTKSVRFSVSDLKEVVRGFLILNPQSSILPILEHMLVKCGSEGSAEFRATNLYTQINTTIGFIGDEISFLFPIKKIMPILANSQSETIDFILKDESPEVTVIVEEVSLKINIEPLSEFPITHDTVKAPGEGKNYLLSACEFNENIKQAARFVSTDELRPAMTYINLCAYNSSLYFVATDAHKLFFRKSKLPFLGYDILLSPVMPRISKHFFKMDQPVAIFKKESLIYITGFGTTIIQKDPDENYPAWQAVLPKDDAIELFVNRKRMESIIKIQNCYSGAVHQLKFEISKSEIKISAQDIYDSNTSTISKIPVLKSNQEDDFVVGFDSRYFLEASSTKNKDELIKITHSANPRNPIVINSEMLLMPVMLNENF